tara:strand:- start:1197 stop:2324 length:1128 start_codon:yes stop_codon:yes gene_type:complete
MKQQIKCPHCNKVFPIEESLKHEAQELRKKLQAEEQKKSKERQKELEDKFNQKLEKQHEAHEKELAKIKTDAQKKLREEAKKQAAEEVKKIRKESEENAKQIKLDAEKKAQKENNALKEELQKSEKAHQIDLQRMRKKAEDAARIASQSPVERKGEVQEELIEEFLKKEFPYDKYEPVKKGKRGADVIQFVQDKKNKIVGKILHESKDVLNFDEKWVGKLLDDMSREDATIGVIFTKVMPKKSNGLVEEREGGRIVICSDYPILRQMVSIHRKLIQQLDLNKLNKNDASSKLQNLYNYINSNEFKLQYRKAIKGIKKEGIQIDKDERSYTMQIKTRKNNFEENKKNINSIITSIISNSELSDDLLDIDDDDPMLE